MINEKLLRALPRRIKVGAYDYRIRIDMETREEDGDFLWGYTDPNFRSIELYGLSEQEPDETSGTLFHELLHGIWNEAKLGAEAGEEDVVLAFEHGIVSLFRDNPRLLNWMKRTWK